MFRILLLLAVALSAAGCNSSLSDIIEVIEEPSRKTIDTTRLGVNAFFNDARFGSISDQAQEVRNTLGLRYVRVLFAWNDQVQPSPDAAINFSFYDAILAAIPSDTQVLVVLTDVPSWMSNQAHWIGGNPRITVAERWIRRAIARYRENGKIVGWQIWNEPNNPSFAENTTIGVVDNPENYVELLAASQSIAKDLTPNKLVLNAATTAINQNFPDTLRYNRAMRDAGARELVDVWAMHYYGRQFENVVRSGGVEDFIDGLNLPVWVTESGAQGVNSQLAYGEQVWPYLIEKMPSIERIFIYQFTDATPADVTYGLRNLTPGLTVSDLYVHLRDRA